MAKNAQKPPPDRGVALDELKRYGITGPSVYLLNVVPLLEMMWADGKIQDNEWELLEEFVGEQVASINAMAGSTVLTPADAEAFLERFSKTRPDAKLLEQLRALIPTVWLANSDGQINAERRDSILKWCLDIGAACVSAYPYGNRERFDANEKARFQSILKTLAG